MPNMPNIPNIPNMPNVPNMPYVKYSKHHENDQYVYKTQSEKLEDKLLFLRNPRAGLLSSKHFNAFT